MQSPFCTQAIMLQVAENASVDDNLSKYSSVLKDIFSRKCSDEQSLAEDIPNVECVSTYVRQTKVLAEYVDKVKVDGIQFPLSRFASHRQTILFAQSVSVKIALKTANQFLSQPMTLDYYNRVRTEQPEIFKEKPPGTIFNGISRWALIGAANHLDGFQMGTLGSGKTSNTKKILVLVTGS